MLNLTEEMEQEIHVSTSSTKSTPRDKSTRVTNMNLTTENNETNTTTSSSLPGNAENTQNFIFTTIATNVTAQTENLNSHVNLNDDGIF